MAALTTIAAVAGTAIAAKSYADNRKQAKKAEAAAQDQQLADNMTAQANADAAASAIQRDSAAREAELAAAQQEKELATSPEVTIENAENNNVRRRRVQAQFNVASGGATAGAGSVRL